MSDVSAKSPHRAAIEGQIRSYEEILRFWVDEMDATERVWADAIEKSEDDDDENSKTK